MKTKHSFLPVILFVLSGIFLLIFTSCKKDKTDSSSGSGTVKDIDGNVYHTITIGTQVWMIENLRVTKYSNGDPIGTTNPPDKNIFGETEPKYQWAYDGDESNAAIYGRLYTWYILTDGRGICPDGWHVPSDDEWQTLVDYLGGSSFAGGKLKARDTTYWKPNGPFGWHANEGATNESGFTALPGGYRWQGGFFYKNYYGYWWTRTEYDTDRAYERSMGYDDGGTGRYENPKNYGDAVRCIKNKSTAKNRSELKRSL
ncbi:MAG: fibrobacter succinogenes major paralogous domain-containing protein [Bacteroidetes bacterium]|nr:fibrobacter succinogenes major paralogous domain-containing protein [Bacteroidota bacterium]